MAEQPTALSYAQVMDEVRRACVEKRTGTMMIATHDNQLARIVLQDGEIVSIAYGLKSGRDAIPLLKGIKEARVKFSQGKVGGELGTGNLPSTPDIMRLLGGDRRSADGPAARSLTVDQLSKALPVIEAQLVEFLGPLANIVWNEHVDRVGKPVTASKVRALIDELAKEIGDPTKIQSFKEQVWQKIGSPRQAG